MIRVHVLSLVIAPNTPADREQLDRGLQQLAAEDPTIHVQTDQHTGRVSLFGMGEGHLEIIVDRLKREFQVEARLGRPRVLYKEAFTRPADGEGRFVRQAANRGLYGHAKIRVYPGEPDTGYVFENRMTRGHIPEHFVTPVNEGIKEALARGVLAGYPIEDVRIELYDGSYHDVDSSDLAFKIAGSMALQDAARRAAPVLLEPIMRVEMSVPTEYVSDVMDDLASRRGNIHSREERDGTQIIQAHVPMAQMFGYASSLGSRTRGRGAHSLSFQRYQPVRHPDGSDDSPESFVGAPLKPTPKIKDAAIALPEPDPPSLA